MQLYCKKCNYKLTVIELQQVFSDNANMKDEESLIGPGLYLNAAEIEISFGKPIDFLVNKESINICNHKDIKRLSGCCGPGELSVLNQVCPNFQVSISRKSCTFFVKKHLQLASYENIRTFGK